MPFLKACGDFGAIYRAQNKINRTARRKNRNFYSQEICITDTEKRPRIATTSTKKRSPSINRIMLSPSINSQINSSKYSLRITH